MSKYIVMVVALAAAACGGPGKPADSASDCPPGTIKQGGDCVAPEDESGPGKAASPEAHGASPSDSSSASAASTGGGADTAAPAAPKTPYDKASVEVVLRRAAMQIKANCGSATGSDGKASGPWGTTKVSITLGRNGHVHDVTLPDPYAGKPVGKCVTLAFQNLVFPPYPAPQDAVVDWDVEIVKPANTK